MFAAFLIWSGSASADDAVVGSGAGTCSEAAFDIALGKLYPGANFPGGTLSFNCGPTPVTIPITSRKTLTGATVVDGGGRITLDGQDGSAHFNIVGAESRIEIRGLDLFRGHAVNSFGGAINVGTGTTLLLTDTQIRASTATLSGGAIHVEANAGLRIERSSFVENSAANGGAIASNSPLTLIGAEFSGNQANGGEGGAIQQWFAALSLVDVNFTDNAARHGGALLLRGVGATGATAKRVRFDDNTASQLGGGAALYDGAVLSGEHVRFSGNRAVDGAGLHLAGQATGNGQPFTLGSGAAMFDAVFDGNEASGLGGAAYVFGIKPPMGGQYSVLHLYDSRVARNLAAEGGGIWSRGQMRLRDCSFDDNGALRGGALTLAPTFTLGESVIPGYAEIERTDFSDNLATQFGGAIYSVDGLPLLDQVNFQRNAANIGGAIMARRFIAPLVNASFVDNFANTAGGALYLQDNGSIQFLNLSFSGNSVFEVGGYGADIAAESTGNTDTVPTQLTMSHSTLIGGQADTGSSIYIGGANTDITLRNSVVLGATEPSCEGVVLSAGGNFLAPSCPSPQPDDVTVSQTAQLGLSALSNAAGKLQVFVPQPGSALIDHVDCMSGRDADARGYAVPVDGNGDNVARCDSGAVERQSNEPAAVFVLFRDGFESNEQG
ncbi:MAG TPA: choice-of-anchor Q domain-containing protein [Pseudomonadota bacterium]|nr:choice-of-anchor Q domain-containing protein [Pseudomonadota bacterium]